MDKFAENHPTAMVIISVPLTLLVFLGIAPLIGVALAWVIIR